MEIQWFKSVFVKWLTPNLSWMTLLSIPNRGPLLTKHHSLKVTHTSSWGSNYTMFPTRKTQRKMVSILSSRVSHTPYYRSPSQKYCEVISGPGEIKSVLCQKSLLNLSMKKGKPFPLTTSTSKKNMVHWSSEYLFN